MTRSGCQPATPSHDRHSNASPFRTRGRTLDSYSGREEPCLGELIEDPIIRRLMASDGVHLDHLMQVIGDARSKLAARVLE